MASTCWPCCFRLLSEVSGLLVRGILTMWRITRPDSGVPESAQRWAEQPKLHLEVGWARTSQAQFPQELIQQRLALSPARAAAGRDHHRPLRPTVTEAETCPSLQSYRDWQAPSGWLMAVMTLKPQKNLLILCPEGLPLGAESMTLLVTCAGEGRVPDP